MSHEITPIAKGTSTISRIIEKIWGKVRINTFLLPCQLPLPPPPHVRLGQKGVHHLNSMLEKLKHQINFTSIIPLNFACVSSYHLLLALFCLCFVAVNGQGQKRSCLQWRVITGAGGGVSYLMQLGKRKKI